MLALTNETLMKHVNIKYDTKKERCFIADSILIKESVMILKKRRNWNMDSDMYSR